MLIREGFWLNLCPLDGREIENEFSAFNALYVAVCTKLIRLIFVGRQLFYLE